VAKGSPEPERGGERFVAKGVARVLDELASPFVANQQPDALRKQQRGVLAPFGLRIIPAMQPSAARGKTAECVA
jgi:hypothetical protein